MRSSNTNAPKTIAFLIGLIALSYSAQHATSRTESAVNFDIGPNTEAYLDGFTESEERMPVTFRWTQTQANISLPLRGTSSSAILKIRLARFLPTESTVRLFVNSKPVGLLKVRPGRFRTIEVPISLNGEMTNISFLVDDPSPERLGIAIDWVRIENAAWALPTTSVEPALLLISFFLFSLSAGISRPISFGVGILVILIQTICLTKQPFATAHVYSQVVIIAVTITSIFAITIKKGRTVALLFLIGYLLKGAVLFHPAYWYSDVRLHRRYVEVLQTAEGSLIERGIEAQRLTGTAYPRTIAGSQYALPYSPLFYVPFTKLNLDARSLESVMKQVGLLIAALELILIFTLSRYLFGTRIAIWSSILAVFLPPMASRLLFAQWPTLAGHLLDWTAFSFAAMSIYRPKDSSPLLLYGVFSLASCLIYISSLFHFILFSCSFAFFNRKQAQKLAIMTVVVSSTTVLLLYLPFLSSVIFNIIPQLLERTNDLTRLGASTDIQSVLERIPLFFGYGFPALSIAGFICARKSNESFRFLSIVGLTFIGLLSLRASSVTFKDLKELVFIGPFIVMTVSLSLDTLFAKGRAGRFAAVAITVGLVGFGLSKIIEYMTLHTQLAGLQ